MIECILLDVDDTIMDYHQAESSVFSRIFEENGMHASQEILDELWRMSWGYWDSYRLSDTWDEAIQLDYHDRYHASMLDFCGGIIKRYGFSMHQAALYERFIHWMSGAASLYDDVLPAMQALSKRHTLCIATNAIQRIQLRRLDCLKPYISHIFCSETMGMVKPMRGYFDEICSITGVPAARCLMVGDSLSSDIAGAAGAGMRSCWVNRAGRTNTTGILPDYTIATLTELLHMQL